MSLDDRQKFQANGQVTGGRILLADREGQRGAEGLQRF